MLASWRSVRFAIVLIACLPSFTFAQTAAPRAAARSGSEIFRTACISCHGPDGRGNPQSFVGFETELPDFSDCRFSTPEQDGDWHTIIELGGTIRRFDRKMPAFKDAFSAEEIDSVIAYLRGFCQDRRWPLGDLNLPRPIVTEKAFPENEAVVTVTFDKASGQRTVSNSFVYEHRIGPRSQYEVVVPFDLQHVEGESWNPGLGDVAVAFKHVVFSNRGAGSILSGGGEVTFPTGKESSGLGGGVTILEPFVAFSQILWTDGFLHVHTGWEASTNHSIANDESYFRTAFGWSFARPNGGRIWSPMLELLAARELGEVEGKTEWDAVPQVQVTLSQRQHIVVNLGLLTPLNLREDRNRRLFFYFLWDWFDGGLFEGW